MLKIWGRTTSSNVQKVLWCCAELGIDYERVDLGGPFGGNRDPEYLTMNPNGRVPTIKDNDLILWESNTICRYLATTRHGERLYPSNPAARANVERWMDWQLATSGPPMAALLGMLIRILIQPLHVMTRAMEDIADGEGDLTKRLTIQNNDEFGILGTAFNRFEIGRAHV